MSGDWQVRERKLVFVEGDGGGGGVGRGGERGKDGGKGSGPTGHLLRCWTLAPHFQDLLASKFVGFIHEPATGAGLGDPYFQILIDFPHPTITEASISDLSVTINFPFLVSSLFYFLISIATCTVVTHKSQNSEGLYRKLFRRLVNTYLVVELSERGEGGVGEGKEGIEMVAFAVVRLTDEDSLLALLGGRPRHCCL